VLLLAAFTPTEPRSQARPQDTGTIVIVVGQEATTPVPTIPSTKANGDVMSLLFLKLARLNGSQGTTGDRA
jgi:hypothetical protein